MNSQHLSLSYLGIEGDKRLLTVEIETLNGTVKGNVWSIELADDTVCFKAVIPQPEKRPPAKLSEGRLVTPLPSCPCVGPNGEIYPMGHAPTYSLKDKILSQRPSIDMMEDRAVALQTHSDLERLKRGQFIASDYYYPSREDA